MTIIVSYSYDEGDKDGKRKARKAAYNRMMRRLNPDKVRAVDRARDRKTYKQEYSRDYYQRNKQRWVEKREALTDDEIIERNRKLREYQRANPALFNALVRTRRLRKIGATPRWLSAEQLRAIKAVYEAAKADGFVVDHIVPVTHPRVCGLHVPWNLQLLTASENARKHNKLPSALNLVDYNASGYKGRKFKARRKLIPRRAA